MSAVIDWIMGRRPLKRGIEIDECGINVTEFECSYFPIDGACCGDDTCCEADNPYCPPCPESYVPNGLPITRPSKEKKPNRQYRFDT
jgi:hypothetical protein